MSSKLISQASILLTMNSLAERLRAALDAAGINQSELSRRVGVTRGAVSFWLKGTITSLEGENLIRTAQALGVSPNWLATGRGKMSPASSKEISFEDNPDYPAVRRVKIKLSAGITGERAHLSSVSPAQHIEPATERAFLRLRRHGV